MTIMLGVIVFHIADSSRVFEDIMQQIQDAILQGRLKPGDKLPSERDLQLTLKASRTTIREALRNLEQKGLIEIKRGKKGGSFIKEISFEKMSENLEMLISWRRISLDELAEFRMNTEADAAGLAAQRATAEDTKELRDLLEEMVDYAKAGQNQILFFYKTDAKLHMLLSRISGNPIYQWVLMAIHKNVSSYYTLLPREKYHIQDIIDNWTQTIEAIEKHDATTVTALAKAHVVRYNYFMIKKAEETGQLSPDGRLRASF